jgi:predicted nucleotidyltransferase component of viral defense system
MIPEFCFIAWRQEVPWVYDYQIEQDLIISRALINLYENKKIKERLVFRGGTALNKLFLKPPVRYSEDIDLVQINSEPIGKIIFEIRTALSWLGEPTSKLTERGVKLFYRYLDRNNSQRKLKIEINTTEHFHFYDFVEYPYSIKNPWFTGEASILSYRLNELIGTKLRALYQRRKGRDLFDLWIVLKNDMVDCSKVVEVFLSHLNIAGSNITRSVFEKNLLEKINNRDFKEDVIQLLVDDKSWSINLAYKMVNDQLICLLPKTETKWATPHASQKRR